MTLAELIRDRKGRRSYDELAIECGGEPGKSRWQQLGDTSRTLRTSPTPENLSSMARALRVTEDTLWMSVGRSLGVQLGRQESQLISRLPPDTQALSPEQENLILALITEFITLQADQEVPAVRTLRAARRTTGSEQRGQQ